MSIKTIDLEHIDTDTWEGFLRAARKVKQQIPNWRYGQCLFNTLAHFHPEIAEYYRGSILDPFNRRDKENIDVFLDDLSTWFL